MNERIRQLSEQAHRSTRDELVHLERVHNRMYDLNESAVIYNEKFAELIVQECTNLLFDESERLYGYSTECDNMRESDEAELVAEKCVDLIAMIEQHFGVEE